MSELEVLKNIEIYPNPVIDQLTISLPKSISGNVSLVVYDYLGKELRQFSEAINSKNQIDISVLNLPSGLYSFQFRHEEVVGFAKFIKE